MGNERKPAHEVLQQFTKIMHDHNPMGLAPDDSYESEALSVLSRFTEGALHMCEDDAMQREIAVGIVSNALEFWFNPGFMKETPEKLSWALLDAFKAANPVHEQNSTSEVHSEA